jgi:predicted nucleic acid-binding protein
MRLLLDTNAYVELRRGNPAVADPVRRARQILFSAVVAGELQYGFRRGSRYRKNQAELLSFLSTQHVTLLPVTLETADRYGRIALALRKKGRPIPTNDIWIAAQAMETGSALLSFDAHFEAVDGLAWIEPDPGDRA